MQKLILSALLVVWPATSPAQSPAEEFDEAAVARVEAHLLAPGRLDFDLTRDPYRKPAALVATLGVRTGMDVLDVGAIAGYSTEILAVAVGPHGSVLAHDKYDSLRRLGKEPGLARQQRMADQRLPNVREHNWLIDQAPLTEQFDLVYWGNNLHDYYNKFGEDKILMILENLMSGLRPGGILGIVDHCGVAEAKNMHLHRVSKDVVKAMIEQAGFEIVKTSDLYNNPDDDYTRSVHEKSIKGKSDRFFFVARKPAAEG